MQRHVTHGLRLEPEGEFRGKLMACSRHFNFFSQASTRAKTGFNALELGTGWFSIIPQNRLRHSDYVSIMERAGFEVVREEAIPGRGGTYAASIWHLNFDPIASRIF